MLTGARADSSKIKEVRAVVAPRDRSRFRLGQTVITRGALGTLSGDDVATAMLRHARGDWGELVAEDRAANDRALEKGGRLVSAYRTARGTKFWIITEADRSVTTVLLPEEY